MDLEAENERMIEASTMKLKSLSYSLGVSAEALSIGSGSRLLEDCRTAVSLREKAEEELEILTRHQQRRDFLKLDAVGPVLSCAEVTELRRCAADIYVEDSLLKYIVQIVQQTRQSKAVYLGASPRATVGLLRAAKAYALLQGRDFVTPDDVKLVAPCVLQHRIILTAESEMEGRTPVKVVRRLIDKVEVPQ